VLRDIRLRNYRRKPQSRLHSTEVLKRLQKQYPFGVKLVEKRFGVHHYSSSPPPEANLKR